MLKQCQFGPPRKCDPNSRFLFLEFGKKIKSCYLKLAGCSMLYPSWKQKQCPVSRHESKYRLVGGAGLYLELFGKLRQEDSKLKTRLGYRVSPRIDWIT